MPSGGTRDQWLDAINNAANWTFAASGTLPTGTIAVQPSQFGIVASSQKIASNTGGFGTLANFDYFGISVAGVGDLDNDGVEDIVVGARGDNTGGTDRGAAYVLLLNSNGSVKAFPKIADNAERRHGYYHYGN